VKYESRGDLAMRVICRIPVGSKVLDVGCGLGYLVRALNDRGMDAWGTDISADVMELSVAKERTIIVSASNLPFPDKSFDVVVSTDFFEHLDESEIDQVFQEMQRVGKCIYARICSKPEPPYHKTVQPQSWWAQRLPGIILIR